MISRGRKSIGSLLIRVSFRMRLKCHLCHPGSDATLDYFFIAFEKMGSILRHFLSPGVFVVIEAEPSFVLFFLFSNHNFLIESSLADQASPIVPGTYFERLLLAECSQQ